MRRFDYLPRHVGVRRTLVIDDAVRAPLAALLVTILATTVGAALQLARLDQARAVRTGAYERLAADEPALAALRAMRAAVAQQVATIERIDQIRRANIARLDELTWIGNRLPAGTWLRSLHLEDGTYTLDGVSSGTTSVGLALDGLRDARTGLTARLVSLRDERDGVSTHVRYALRLSPTR